MKLAISKIKNDVKKLQGNLTIDVLRRQILLFVAQDTVHKEQMLPGIFALLECSDSERISSMEAWKKTKRL